MDQQTRRRHREWAEKLVRTAPQYEQRCHEALATHNRDKAAGRLGPNEALAPTNRHEQNGLVQQQRWFMIMGARILTMYRAGELEEDD